MQEAEEQDTCRICSAPADTEQPLFHPCKCSGTIRYIHQDCLTTWLAHSKKKNCDVCKHPYSFTKVYAPDMPPTLPVLLVIRRLIQQGLFGLLFVVRAIAVATIWLAILPWATVWTWRMYFSMGESTAWWISERPRPPTTETNPFYYTVSSDASGPPPTTYLGRLTAHPLWIALSADIFTGQIIASLIVLTFVAVFLLREWISQNARPGVFEDEEILPDDQPVAQIQPAGQAQVGVQVLPAENNPLDEALAQRQIEALRALDALRARDGVNGHIVGDERHHHGRSPLERPKKKGKARERIMDSLNSFELDSPARTRRKLLPKGQSVPERDLALERKQKQAWFRRVQTARMAGARRRAALAAINSQQTKNSLSVDPRFEFTFKANSQSSRGKTKSFSEPRGKMQLNPDNPEYPAAITFPSTPIFPQVTLMPPRATIPFSFDRSKSLLAGADTDTNASPSIHPLTQAGARRPPLPATTTSTLGFTSSSVPSPALTPLGSPSLATYRAPEDLEANEAGPSRLQDYFDQAKEENNKEEFSEWEDEDEPADEQSSMDTQNELDRYFGEPNETGTRSKISGLSDSESGEEDDEGDGESEEGHSDDDVTINSEGEEDDDDDDEGEDEEEGDEGEGGADEGLVPANGFVNDQGRWQAIGVNENGEIVDEEAQAAGQAQAPADDGAPIDNNDEIEGNVEDDMEGAMEAIGMRGPIYGVFQNAALMIFVLDTAIGLGIWIPFTIGKSTALLLLNPPRFLQLLHLPIRAIRIVTDPIVDSVAFILIEVVLPAFIRIGKHITTIIAFSLWFLVDKAVGHRQADGLSKFAAKMENHITRFSDKPLERIFTWTASVAKPETVSDTASSASILDMELPWFLSKAEPYFATLGKDIRLGSVQLQTTWERLALGEGPSERAFAVILGYVVLCLLLALYLNILTVSNAKTAGRAVRSAVRQQLLVLKVAAFIFIELVTFPLGCGIVLDLCTVWLFPEANLLARTTFFFQAPLTAMFYHWVAGTMFMYSFAILLSGCRSVMRAGAMWFIKDPQDQNSHPIRDILDRPTLTQLRKICISGIMYSCVVACVVGSVAGLLLLGSKSIMPFRWKNREPLSNVPVDLLFLHLVLPHTMDYFRPKKALKDFATMLWKAVAARLRLTSYFFGGRYPNEEYTPKGWRGFSLRLPANLNAANAVSDGTFRRVPATDNLALPRDMRATAAVTETGEPIDDTAKELMALQDAEAEKAKRNIKDDYMVVYLPPHFRYRVFCFIGLLWVIGAILLGVAVALPIQLGRSMFALFTTREIHDGYALIVGFYLLWGCYLIGTAIDRLDKGRQRFGPRADLRVLVVKRGLLWVAKAIYMVVFLGIVIPTLVSFVIDLYLVLPIRFALDPDTTPRIRIVDTWALGLLYVKIALHANRIQPPNRITRGIQHIISHGWSDPHPAQATKEVIGPVVGGLLGMIIFPGAIFQAVQYFLPTLPVDDKFIFMHIYPGIFMFAGVIRSAVVLHGLLSSWSQSIRDKEFLVELRLRNHEPEKVNKRDDILLPAVSEVGIEQPNN